MAVKAWLNESLASEQKMNYVSFQWPQCGCDPLSGLLHFGTAVPHSRSDRPQPIDAAGIARAEVLFAYELIAQLLPSLYRMEGACPC